MNDNDFSEDLEGVLHFFSETGTEGGSWAFQNSLYIKKDVNKGYCKKCGIGMTEQGGVLQLERVIHIDEEVLQELSLTGEIPEPEYCPDDNHEEEIGDAWSYEGLHILGNGDNLTIYDPDDKDKIIWSGEIALKYHTQFTENIEGLWIHADQIGIEREVWAEYFFENYPARLKPIKEKSDQ